MLLLAPWTMKIWRMFSQTFKYFLSCDFIHVQFPIKTNCIQFILLHFCFDLFVLYQTLWLCKPSNSCYLTCFSSRKRFLLSIYYFMINTFAPNFIIYCAYTLSTLQSACYIGDQVVKKQRNHQHICISDELRQIMYEIYKFTEDH